MEVNKIINGVETLQKLNKQDFTLATTLKIMKNSEEFDKVLKIFNDKRTKLLENFDAKEASTEQTLAKTNEIKELLSEDIDITFKKLTIKELEDMKLSSIELASIIWLIDEE